jgi:hypothetical protein
MGRRVCGPHPRAQSARCEERNYCFYRESNKYASNYVKYSFLEKLTVAHVVKKFPVFYGTRRFITVFCWTLFWTKWMYSKSSSYFSKMHIGIILPYVLRFSKWFLLGFRLQFSMHFSYFQCVLRAPPISFLVWLICLIKSTSYEAPYHVHFSRQLVLYLVDFFLFYYL